MYVYVLCFLQAGIWLLWNLHNFSMASDSRAVAHTAVPIIAWTGVVWC